MQVQLLLTSGLSVRVLEVSQNEKLKSKFSIEQLK